MIHIERGPGPDGRRTRRPYPNECCGAMLGTIDGDEKTGDVCAALENAYAGAQAQRYELRPEDLLSRRPRGARAEAGPDRHLPFSIPTATPIFQKPI